MTPTTTSERQRTICQHDQLKRQCPLCDRDTQIVELRDALNIALPYVYDAKAIGGFKAGVVEGHIRQIETALSDSKWVEDAKDVAP